MYLAPILPLIINMKPYTVSSIALSYLTLSDLQVRSQGHQDFKALYPVKAPS